MSTTGHNVKFCKSPETRFGDQTGLMFSPSIPLFPQPTEEHGNTKNQLWDTHALHAGDGSLGKQTPAYQFAQRCRQKPRADKHWLWMKKDTRKKAENEDWGGFIGQTNKQNLSFDKGSLARPDDPLPCGDIRLMWWITWQAKQRRLKEAERGRGY